jgi:hypothetical protein
LIFLAELMIAVHKEQAIQKERRGYQYGPVSMSWARCRLNGRIERFSISRSYAKNEKRPDVYVFCNLLKAGKLQNALAGGSL